MGQQPTKTSIYPSPRLLADLRALASQERRSLNQQILHMLDEYLVHLDGWDGSDLTFTVFDKETTPNGNA